MGWTIPYHMPRLRDLIADRTRPEAQDNPDGAKVRRTALRHCYRGGRFSGTLYVVWEVTQTAPDGRAETTRFVGVDLVRYYRDGDGGNWGYKDIDCCMGPCQLSCPPGYLDLCPPHDGEWCRGWHAKVRAAHAEGVARRRARRAQGAVA